MRRHRRRSRESVGAFAAAVAVVAAAALIAGGPALGLAPPPRASSAGAPRATTPPTLPGATTIASLPADVPISAADGWVAWSVPVPDGWGLEAWHAGHTMALAAAPRPQPFDVDVGTDAAGHVVATFSRCAVTPRQSGYGLNALTLPSTGSGCRIRILDPITGRERSAGVPPAAGTSDTTPSMWAGRIAFSRLDPAHHRQVSQVMLWTPSTHRLQSLIHGAMPPGCAPIGRCPGDVLIGGVQALDLGPAAVSFLWLINASDIVGDLAWEVRADTLPGDRTELAGVGDVGEACTGGIDSVPSAPTLVGDALWYAELDTNCYVGNTTLVRFDPATSRASNATLDAYVLALSADGGDLDALVAPDPDGEVQPSCSASAPCALERLPPPALKPYRGKPSEPFG